MSFVHGRNTYISLNGSVLSAYCNDSEFGRTSDSHDVTTYGKNSKCYSGGLLDGTFTMKGVYDNTTAGPRDIIEPLIGTNVTLIRRVEGTGSGLPQDSVTVLVTKYVETSPVADMVSWSCDCQCSDDITSTNQ
jgi:hypothetical protein